MFTPEKMQQIHIVFSEKDIDRVTDTVVQSGTFQLTDAAEIETWAQTLPVAGTGEVSPEMKARLENLENLFQKLGWTQKLSPVVSSNESWRELDRKVSEISDSLGRDIDALEELKNEGVKLRQLRDGLSGISLPETLIQNKTHYSYLFVETGQVPEENINDLRMKLNPILHVFMPLQRFGGKVAFLVISLSRDKERLESILRDVGAQPVDPMLYQDISSPDLLRDIHSKIQELEEKKIHIQKKIDTVAAEQKLFLESVLYRVKKENIKQSIFKYFRKTEHTCLLSGWLPRQKRDAFLLAIQKATRNRCVIEENPAEDLEQVKSGDLHVPIQLNNPSFIKPFELLTKTYGLPAYLSLDPTPLLGISFMIMFGVMFGDVGHGLVLLLLGLIMAFKGKKESMKSAGLLLSYVGISSIVFGFLFGSIFGLEHVLPALWLKPMESITELFGVAIYFGMGMIFLSIAINLVNGFRKRDFLGMIFDKAGFLAAILYWCGIVVATRIVSTQPQARADLPILIPLLMIGSITLLFLREPIVHLIRGKKQLFPEGVTTGIMGGMVELLEIFLGFLANTVSFIRVAAFGLAHAGLFMAIFALSDAVRGAGGGIYSVLVLIFGNILIILLEGLVVSIQAVRLEFYEFFGRFFQTSDSGYKPVGVER